MYANIHTCIQTYVHICINAHALYTSIYKYIQVYTNINNYISMNNVDGDLIILRDLSGAIIASSKKMPDEPIEVQRHESPTPPAVAAAVADVNTIEYKNDRSLSSLSRQIIYATGGHNIQVRIFNTKFNGKKNQKYNRYI